MSSDAGRSSFTVSLCMIVKNEEKYLRGCLESARPYVDEIVIVDTGSTDATVSIAEEFGAVIRTFPWNGNFSDARNESLRHATGEWILYLDADERLRNGAELRALRPHPQVVAYNVSISSKHILPSGTVDQVNQYQRFFRRHPKIRFEGVVHEQVLPSLLRMNKRIEPCPLFIDHLGYGESLEKINQKCVRNAELLRRQLEQNPHDYYAHYQLGNTLGVMLQYDEAEQHLTLAVEHDRNVSIRASACNILVEISMHRSDLDAAERWCRMSTKLVPVQVMGHWFLAGILAHRKQFGEALRSIDIMLSHTGKPTGLAHDLQVPEGELNYRTIVCYEGLANAAVAASDIARAHLLVNAAEERGLRSPKLQTIGIQTAMALNDYDTALQRIDFMLRNLPPDAEAQKVRFRTIRSKIESMAVA
jgi:glycosyltransferase involved in cell wall biosynthesis